MYRKDAEHVKKTNGLFAFLCVLGVFARNDFPRACQFSESNMSNGFSRLAALLLDNYRMMMA